MRLPFRPRHLSRDWPGGVIAERYSHLRANEVRVPPETHVRVSLQLRHAPGGRHRWRWGGRTGEGAFAGPHLTVTPAGTEHEWAWDGPAESLHLLLPPALLADAAGHLAGRPGGTPPELLPCVGDPADATSIRLMRALDAELRSPTNGPAYIKHIVGALALRLIARHGTKPAPPVPPPFKGKLTGNQLAAVEELMRAHLEHGLGVERMAAALDLSASHFTHLFHNTTGHAPHRHLMELKLLRARELLATRPDLTVTTVAFSCGFSDASHLGRQFKARFGVRPLAFRKGAQ